MLAKPCAHKKLRCANCQLEHAADDSVCEYRRRMRGSLQSAPPMSSGSGKPTEARAAAPPAKKKGKKKKIHILQPHEPFPDDGPAPAPATLAETAPTAPAPQDAPPVSGSTVKGTPPPVEQTEQRPGRTLSTRDKGADEAGPPPAPEPAGTTARSAPRKTLAADDADLVALQDLVGPGKTQAAPPTRSDAQRSASAVSAPDQRRTTSTRIAGAEAAKDARRRRVAHVLTRNFKFLDHPAAVAALKTRADDYVSTVSWAAEERSRRSKPGMQAKMTSSLHKIVESMTTIAQNDPPATGTDTDAAPVNA